MERARPAALEERLELCGHLVGLLRLQEVSAVEGHAPRPVGPLAELVEEAVVVEAPVWKSTSVPGTR